MSKNTNSTFKHTLNCSTGPRTSAGKKKSSQNSRRHGLLGAPSFQSPEQKAEFDKLLSDLRDSFSPQNGAQEIEVRSLAETYWRLRQAQGWTERYMRMLVRSNLHATLKNFFGKSHVLQLPIPGLEGKEVTSNSTSPFYCDEVTLRIGNNQQTESTLSAENAEPQIVNDSDMEHYGIGMRLNSKISAIERYETKFDRKIERILKRLILLRQLEPARKKT